MDREFAKRNPEMFLGSPPILAYDANDPQRVIRVSPAGFGQLITLSGIGAKGKDMTNDLTYVILEVIDEMSPSWSQAQRTAAPATVLKSCYDKVVDMIESSQGAPFLLNFDERSMAGMMLEARKAGLTHS